jgi:hypothetical protein
MRDSIPGEQAPIAPVAEVPGIRGAFCLFRTLSNWGYQRSGNPAFMIWPDPSVNTADNPARSWKSWFPARRTVILTKPAVCS